MLKVTQKAQEQVARYFQDNEIKPIRVFLTSSCGGPQIALTLDDPKPNDHIFEIAGIQYLVDKAFLDQAQPIEMDFRRQGFEVSSTLELGGGCGGCSGCGSSGTYCG